MKQALLLLALALPLSAQVGKAAPAAPVEVIDAASTMRLSEQKEVLAASIALLGASLDFRGDGTARTTHQVGNFSTRIELMGLTVSQIVKASVSTEDRQKGISRRYIAYLTCKAHRLWDGPMVSWSEWRDKGYGFFPSSLIVEEIDGALTARAKRIEDFSPGIDSEMTASR